MKNFLKNHWEELTDNINFGAFIKTVLTISIPWILMDFIQKDWFDMACLILWGTLIYEFYDKDE